MGIVWPEQSDAQKCIRISIKNRNSEKRWKGDTNMVN